MQRPRAGSVRLPLYDTSLASRRSPSPDSAAYRARARRKRRAFLTAPSFSFRGRNYTLIARCVLGALVLLGICFWWAWEVHIEVAFYQRAWIRQEVERTEPLAGCFDPRNVSPAYNLTAAAQAKKYDVQAGLPMRMGMDCYDFAGTIGAVPHESLLREGHRHNFHTYWRVDLVPFAERQEWMLKSFFATQNLPYVKLILWSNGDLSHNSYVMPYLRRYPDAFEVRTVNVEQLARGTKLDGSHLLYSKDNLAWVDGDLVRLLVTWAVGGVWIDMDTLLTRDLIPLLEHEFVTQWDCYDKKYQPLNGALMHFRKHSPYLCEAFHIMARSHAPRSGTTDWGSSLYLKLWRRVVAAGITPFKILPFCFSDGRSCRLDNRLPDPFKADPKTWAGGRSLEDGAELDQALGKVFAVHLHNQWEKRFPKDGWVDRLLLTRYENRLRPAGFAN